MAKKLMCWKQSNFFQTGFAYESKNKSNLQIVDGQFGGFDITVWDVKNKKFIHRSKAKTLKLAQSKAHSYMGKHDKC